MLQKCNNRVGIIMNVKKSILKIVTIFILITLITTTVPAKKIDPVNLYSVYGFLTIDGTPAPDGVIVTLSVQGVVKALDTTSNQGRYVLDFEAHEGDIASFIITMDGQHYTPTPSTLIIPPGGSEPVAIFLNLSVLIQNQPPSIPHNPTPMNGATDIDFSTAIIYWYGGDPDEEDYVRYHIYFGTDPENLDYYGATIFYPSNISGPFVHNFNFSLNQGTKYYWEIIAEDDEYHLTNGPLWNFTTRINNPPYVPQDPEPSNGSIDVSVNTSLYWYDEDPDWEDDVTYDVFFGTTNPPPIIVHNQSSTSYDPNSLAYNSNYYWKIIAWDNHGASTSGSLWSFTTEPQPDTTLPKVQITSPQKSFLYFNFRDLIVIKFPFITTFIFGKIEVTVNATDEQSGIDRVEFSIDDEIQATDTTAPYSWIWSEREPLFPYMIKATAYDKVGNMKSTEIKVWRFR